MIVGVTGGTGFIGKSLILRHIQEGDGVRLLSRNPGHESKLSKSLGAGEYFFLLCVSQP